MKKWGKRMLIGTLILVAVAVTLWIGYTYFYEGNLDQPDYVVLAEKGDVEYRRYSPFIIASTKPDNIGATGLRSGFRILAKYIFGGNKPGESLAMTAPVLQQEGAGETLPMTAPVIQSSGGMRMAFVMPAGRTLADLPVPNSGAIDLTEVSWGEVAAMRFSGWGKQARFKEVEARLQAALKDAGRNVRGPAVYAQYNSPSAFPLLRRNEVIIPILSE